MPKKQPEQEPIAENLQESQSKPIAEQEPNLTTRKVKMLRNVNVRACCVKEYEPYELKEATPLPGGRKRFEIDKVYELKYERAEDWMVKGYCEYIH